MIDLHRKGFVIFGLRGTGKSTLANHIGNVFGSKCLVYDTLNEVPENAKYDAYVPKIRNNSSELEMLIMGVKNSSEYQLLLIDEANRFCPSKPVPLPPEVADVNDQMRHYNLSIGYIARRPCQLNQDLTELSDYMFIYHLTGKADIAYLRNISEGLGEAVLKLPEFHFVMVLPDRSFKVMKPIKPDLKWLAAAKAHLKGTK